MRPSKLAARIVLAALILGLAGIAVLAACNAFAVVVDVKR